MNKSATATNEPRPEATRCATQGTVQTARSSSTCVQKHLRKDILICICRIRHPFVDEGLQAHRCSRGMLGKPGQSKCVLHFHMQESMRASKAATTLRQSKTPALGLLVPAMEPFCNNGAKGPPWNHEICGRCDADRDLMHTKKASC